MGLRQEIQDIFPIADKYADAILALPEIAAGQELLDMIPEGEYCWRGGQTACPFSGHFRCLVRQKPLETQDSGEWVKLLNCPRRFKGSA